MEPSLPRLSVAEETPAGAVCQGRRDKDASGDAEPRAGRTECSEAGSAEGTRAEDGGKEHSYVWTGAGGRKAEVGDEVQGAWIEGASR